jgi:L-aspartate oxidase
MKQSIADFVVVGTGIAGLATSLYLADYGRVALITKKQMENCNTVRAQGGIAAAIGEEDSPELHKLDTLRAGGELCNPEVVEVLVQNGPASVRKLVEWGTEFDREGDHYQLGKEAAHTVSRILHVSGDQTGNGIHQALMKSVLKREEVHIFEETEAVELLVEERQCLGVLAYDGDSHLFLAQRGVVLATGGCGQIFAYTTNDLVATGDGIAMAYRAGVALQDMEFVQFHPTALHVEHNPMFLISEAVRGEGAILLDAQGERFMEKVHPWKELAPRDVVARAIYERIQEGNTVFLNARKITNFATRFPKITSQCKRFGLDPLHDLLPVTPAAHFLMGGIATDSNGCTSLRRLYAVGEVACTGVHGANRLASNSLLEGIVFAQKVAAHLSTLSPLPKEKLIKQKIASIPQPFQEKQSENHWKRKIREIAWKYAGIIRTEKGLKTGIKEIESLLKQIPFSARECHNMCQVAQIILQAALWRKESRGGHYRMDYPKSSKLWEKKHSII